MASEDITFCMRTDCEIEYCFRNMKNIRDYDYHSIADLQDTEDCLKRKKVE